MKTLKSALSFVIILFLLSGCQPKQQAEEQNPDEKKLRFIFITTVVHEDFFKPVKKGMEDAARMMDVECTFTGTEGVDVVAQAEMVRDAIRLGYDGIALNIIDPEAFDAVAEEAAEAGIPLVAFNVDDASTPNARLSSVNQRLYEAGKTLGIEAARFIENGSHILMTMHDEGVSALNDRLRGAQNGLREAGLDEVTWKLVITGSTAEAASGVITGELQADPRIRCVLCTGQADTEGAGMAISEHFPQQGYQAAGFDLSNAILESIRAGHLAFTIDQQPYIQGFYPVIQLALLIRFGIKPGNIDAGATVIDLRNVDEVVEQTIKGYR